MADGLTSSGRAAYYDEIPPKREDRRDNDEKKYLCSSDHDSGSILPDCLKQYETGRGI